MAEYVRVPKGQFCWVELQTADPRGARRFYGGLFGWVFEELPLPAGPYTIAKLNDEQVAGLAALPEQTARLGAPPSWASYVAVDDVPTTAAAAAQLGAKVLVEPTQMGPGTFAALQDPTGALFMLWRAPEHPAGTFRYGEPGALAWNELLSTNVDIAQRFYTQLFGWSAEPTQMPKGTYVVLKKGDTPVGGLMPQPQGMDMPSFWAVYFAVADADATFATARELGASVMLPLADFPKVGRLGWLRDPQGAVFAVIKGAR